MDWIHCNVCFLQPSKEKAFSLTSCGHMYCSDCMGNGTNGECKICQSRCTCIQLVQDMEPDVKDFFSQPEDIVTKLMQVLEFQKKHRMRLTAHWISLNQKYRGAKSEIVRLRTITEKLYNNMKILHKQNKLLKITANENNGQVQMTPFTSQPLQVPFHCSVKKSNQANAIQNTPSTQNYSSKFVTPHKVNKQRHGNGYSVINGLTVAKHPEPMKYTRNDAHAFLTPPSETPPNIFNYICS